MSNNLPTTMFLDAMVGATAYGHPHLETHDFPHSTAAMAHVERARVDLYCDHNNLAIAAIREARRALKTTSSPGVADALAALDEASWMTRHNDFLRAELALEHALMVMRAMPGRH